MNRIQKFRERKGWTQQDLADQLGVSQATVQRWESGQRFPRRENLRALADILEVRPADLMESILDADLANEVEEVNDDPALGPLRNLGYRRYRVLSDSVSRSGINSGDVILVDCDSSRFTGTAGAGAIVIVEAVTETKERVLVLRQYLPPDLITTNRNGTNLAVSLSDVDRDLSLFGLVIRE